jgi:hypothetical protein
MGLFTIIIILLFTNLISISTVVNLGLRILSAEKKITMLEKSEKIRLGNCRIWSTLRQDTTPAFV